MDNELIAKNLELLADLLEFQGTNPFRLRAYRNGAKAIREFPRSVDSMLNEGIDLEQIEGVGKSVAQKCVELCRNGRLQQLEDILTVVPRSVLRLLDIPKLGPKKAAALFHELGIADLDALRTACLAGKVRSLPGFGEKTEQAILDAIPMAASIGKRLLWAEADKIVQQIRIHFSDCPAVQHIEFAGSYRRGKETVGDLDILIISKCPSDVMDHFQNVPDIDQVIARGDTKMVIRNRDEFQIDLRVVPQESFGAALQYFTGSQEHNITVRSRGKQQGLKINEWGVFKTGPSGDLRVAGATEADVYQALELPLFPPELRENRREFEFADRHYLPQLIQLSDIRGDLHMHTTASDGQAAISELAAAAKARGLQYIAITDHSKRVAMARGLNEKRLLEQWLEIEALNAAAEDGFLILKGVECDILEAGGMDIRDDVLAQADWVIGSLHYGNWQPRQQITDRIIGALEHPHVNMIAHPTGRILNRRPPYDVDLEAVFQAAVENRKMLELNASPKRLDLNDVYLLAAKDRNIPIVINTDAHRIADLANMRFGILQARRGCLEQTHVANTWPWEEIRNYFKQPTK